MTIANRKRVANSWLAFIPIANINLMTQIGKQPGWYTAGILLGLIPMIGTLAVLVLMVFLWWKIAEVCGKPGWWGVLFVIPIVNLVIVGMLAWGK